VNPSSPTPKIPQTTESASTSGLTIRFAASITARAHPLRVHAVGGSRLDAVPTSTGCSASTPAESHGHVEPHDGLRVRRSGG
jgi:hypothetical protein